MESALMITRSALLLVLAACSSFSQAQSPTDIPASAFAELPGFAWARLSPDGEHLAYMYPIDGRWNMIVHNFATEKKTRVPPPGDLDYKWLHWANDETIVYSLTFSAERDLTETTETRLVGFNITTQKTEPLIIPAVKVGTASSRTAREKYGNAQIQDDVIDWLPDEPNHILVSLDEDHDGTREVRRIDIRTGKYKIVQRWTEGIQHWVTDANHDVRMGWGRDAVNNFSLVLKKDDGEWEHLTSVDWFTNTSWYPEGFSDDGKNVIVYGYETTDKAKYALLDPKTGDVAEVVAADERFDMEDIARHPWTGKPVGATYVDDATYRTKYWDAALEGLQRSVDKAMPGTWNNIASVTADQRKVLVIASSDRDAGMVLIWDRDARRMDPFGWYYQALDPELMSPVKSVSYEARDGTEIPAYLTLPISADGSNLPTVVLPHGGPHARDLGGFDWLAQFLASRGYAVLQPNFRGSTGYGWQHERAGRKQWGGLMQDDVDDGAKWLVAEGIADPQRIAIAGGSYGGYSAAMGLIKAPGLYQCGVGFNGVYNLPQLIVDDKKYINGSIWTRSMGLEDEGAKAVSPVHRAKEMSAPFLIVQAKDDARVQPYHANDLARAMERADKPHKLVMVERGGHTLRDAGSRETLLVEMEAFLGECLGGT